MANVKLSQIAASGSPPAGSDQLVGVTGGTTDNLFTLTQVQSAISPVGANPTGTASDAAVNGVATTFMRSDGAPAVQKTSSTLFGLAKVDNSTITASAGVISTPGGHNPTATGSDSAVNGSATTFMRSDGAPAIQLGTASVKGLLQGDGATLSISSGVISVDLTHGNTWTGAQIMRLNPRISSAASGDISPSIATADEYIRTALAASCTINAPTGTPLNGNKLIFRLLDNGSSQTLSWDTIYRIIGVTLPTSTTAGKISYVGAIYNSDDTKWDVVAVTTQA